MKKLKKLISVILCVIALLTVLPVPVLAQEVKIKQADDHTVISSRYAFQPRFIVGQTRVEPFGFVTDEKDVWSDNSTGGNYSTVEMVAIKDESQKGNIGVWYRNVGQYQGNTIDLKITISDWKEIRTVNTSINGKPNYPSVEFWKERILIGISTDSFHDIKFKYEFFNSDNKQPVDVTGHLTFADIDASEQLTLNSNTFDKAYTSTNSVLSIQNNKISCTANISTSNNDTSTWCTVLFNTHELKFSYNRTIDNINASTSRRYFSMLTTNAVSIPFGTPLLVKSVSKEVITTEDTYDYLLYMNTPAQPSGKEYTSFVISDTLDRNITLADKSVIVKTDSGVDLSKYFTMDFNDQDIKITADESLLKNSWFYNQQLIFSFSVKIKDTHNFDVSESKAIIYNNSAVQTNYGSETSNTVQTEVRFNLDTKITNGTITKSEYNIPGGSERTITFTPDEGYYVSSIIADRKSIDVLQYKEGGSYSFSNINDNHYLEVICSPYKYHNINIRYLDENNNILANEYNQKLREELEYDVGKTANKDIQYYHLVSIEGGNTSGVINSDVNIVVRYERNQNNVTVNYIDEETDKQLANSVQKKFAQGSEYDISSDTAKKIEHYTLSHIDGSITGVITDNIIINIYYKKNKGCVTVNYLDDKGKPLAQAETLTDYVTKEYKTEEKSFSGYYLSAVPDNASGIFTEEDITVTYIYSKNAIIPVKKIKSPNTGNPISILVNYRTMLALFIMILILSVKKNPRITANDYIKQA